MKLCFFTIFSLLLLLSGCLRNEGTEKEINIPLGSTGAYTIRCYYDGKIVIQEQSNDKPTVLGKETQFYNISGKYFKTAGECFTLDNNQVKLKN